MKKETAGTSTEAGIAGDFPIEIAPGKDEIIAALEGQVANLRIEITQLGYELEDARDTLAQAAKPQIAHAQPYDMEDQIDRKFTLLATSRSGNVYDESNAVVFLARDPALLYALEGYLQGCTALGTDTMQLEAVKHLLARVEKFQTENTPQLAGVETDAEMQRLS